MAQTSDTDDINLRQLHFSEISDQEYLDLREEIHLIQSENKLDMSEKASKRKRLEEEKDEISKIQDFSLDEEKTPSENLQAFVKINKTTMDKQLKTTDTLTKSVKELDEDQEEISNQVWHEYD